MQTSRAFAIIGTVLFVAAGAAFGFAFYVLGVWLALGCGASLAWLATAQLREDRPETTKELARLADNLAKVEERCAQLTLHFTSAFPLQQRRRSLIQPPVPGSPP